MFLFHVLGLCFEGVRDYLLLLICSVFVWVFRAQPSFGPTCVLCLHSLDSLSSLFELFFSFLFLLVWCFLWVLVCFFSIIVVILGLSFLDCSVLMLLLLLHVLAARLSVGVFGLPFYGNPPGGSYGYGQPGGVNICFGFSHNRGVWVKTGAVPQGEVFANFRLLQKRASKRSKRTAVFNFSQEMLQIMGGGGFRIFL